VRFIRSFCRDRIKTARTAQETEMELLTTANVDSTQEDGNVSNPAY
jgi:hypothetical protein